MYATCLFCTRPLGRNETVEAFPVGRRLAFDARRGRLWVVCGACRGWNLSPLEERWEAIEACERLFRGTRLRVSTDHVGLARVGDGLELVRIGEPLRPEFAAWRYGDRFAARRRRAIVRRAASAAAGVVTVGAAAGATALIGVATIAVSAATLGAVAGGALAGIAMSTAADAMRGAPTHPSNRIRVVVRDDDGRPLRVRERDIAETGIVGGDGELALRLRHADGDALLVGRAARGALAALLPMVNERSGDAADVRRAVARIEHAGNATAFLDGVAHLGVKWTHVPARGAWLNAYGNDSDEPPPTSGLRGLATSVALAIEMAAHEETERRALEGELAQLEQAWRDAEEIGRIADGLLLSERVVRAVDRLRGR